MTCALVIPAEGLMELYTYETDWKAVLENAGGSEPYVWLDLKADGVDQAKLLMTLAPDQPHNDRAQQAVVALVGSWVVMTGTAILTGITEDQAKTIMGEVR